MVTSAPPAAPSGSWYDVWPGSTLGLSWAPLGGVGTAHRGVPDRTSSTRAWLSRDDGASDAEERGDDGSESTRVARYRWDDNGVLQSASLPDGSRVQYQRNGQGQIVGTLVRREAPETRSYRITDGRITEYQVNMMVTFVLDD